MAPRIGHIENIQFSSPGLLQWETGCVWHNITPQDRTALFTELYLAMGRLLAALGQYGDALFALQQGLFHTERENLPDLAKQAIIPLKLAITSALLEKGELKNADSNLSHLQEQFNQTQYPEYFIYWLQLSGKLDLLKGNLGAGLKKFQQVQKRCGQIHLKHTVLYSNLNLAYILILLNQTSAAENYLVNTKSNALSIGDTTLATQAKLLLQLCHARSNSLIEGSPPSVSKMRQIKHEQKHLTEEKVKLDLSNQSPNHLAWFENRALAFRWQLSEFNLETASALLRQIQDVFKFTDSHLIQTQIQVLQGIFNYYQGTESNDSNKIYQAHQILEKVCPQLDMMGLKQAVWQVQRFLIWCRTRLNYPIPEIEALTLSTNQLLEQMTSSLKPKDQIFYLLNKWTADEEYIAAQINQLQQMQLKLGRNAFWLRPWKRLQVMQKLNKLVEHIDKYKDILVKRTIKGETAKVPFLPPTSLRLRLLNHPKDRITLSFLILPDRILIVIMGWFLFDFRIIPTTRLAIRNLVQRWYKSIKAINHSRDIINPDCLDYHETIESVAQIGQDIANELADILEIPQLLDKLPKHIRALTIVPDDILHGFPFATISYKGKYLIEHYALSIAYDSKGRRSPTPSTISKKEALVVGISNGSNQFVPLPQVKNELKRVKKWLSHQPIHTRILENCSKSQVVKSLSQAKQFHIACHGVFKLNQPDHSGLVFISDSGQQEILSLRELSKMDLTQLCHATLSSCWSADHFILPRRWVISLSETLWRSGTQSILSCLWEVKDEFAVSFMNRFYKYLYLHKFPRDEALRHTQLDCLRNCLYEPIIEDKFRLFAIKLLQALPISHSIRDKLIRHCIESQSKEQHKIREGDTEKLLFWAGFNIYGDYTVLKL